MIKINKVMLIDEHNQRGIDERGGVKQPQENNLALSFGVVPAEKKPWPYEIVLHTELTAEQGDDNKERTSPIFSSDLRYAAEFDQKEIPEEKLLEAFSSAWPFVRADLIECYRRFDFPTQMIPFRIEPEEHQ